MIGGVIALNLGQSLTQIFYGGLDVTEMISVLGF